jgi:hypothetical protein
MLAQFANAQGKMLLHQQSARRLQGQLGPAMAAIDQTVAQLQAALGLGAKDRARLGAQGHSLQGKCKVGAWATAWGQGRRWRRRPHERQSTSCRGPLLHACRLGVCYLPAFALCTSHGGLADLALPPPLLPACSSS